MLNGKRIRHKHQPVYIGVTVDRSLTFRSHMVKTAAKVQTRNNLITKLAGSTWGPSVRTLRTAALALCFSVAEYCAPVWCRSTHTKLVDIQLNSVMRTVSGSLTSTPVPWLSVLSNIAPASIRRMSASVKAMDKIRHHPNLPVFDDLIALPEARLPSRSPIWSTVLQPDWSIDEAWK